MKPHSVKLSEIKQEVYRLTHTSTTQQFKKECSEHHKGRDLRYKKHWAEILSELIEHPTLVDPPTDDFDVTSMSIEAINSWLDNIAQADSEQEERHRQMYYAIGSLLGWSVEERDIRWARIQLRAQWEAEMTTEVL